MAFERFEKRFGRSAADTEPAVSIFRISEKNGIFSLYINAAAVQKFDLAADPDMRVFIFFDTTTRRIGLEFTKEVRHRYSYSLKFANDHRTAQVNLSRFCKVYGINPELYSRVPIIKDEGGMLVISPVKRGTKK